MTASRNGLEAAIAVTRFGLGAKAGEIAEASSDPRGFLKAQIRRQGAETFATAGETSVERLGELREYRRRRAMAKQGGQAKDADADPVKAARMLVRDDLRGDVQARLRLATGTEAGFRERWALFWANHFTVSAAKVQTATLVGPFENEAIRPHVFGRFADLLSAVETHPAMLIYLDQVQSIGPNSRAAQFLKRRGRRAQADEGVPRAKGLNENLAREILELHTVGVDGGYAQADVTEFARALTGLSLAGPREGALQGQVIFRELAHEPGARTVMGVRYAGDGKAQAAAVLADLAARPQTARFVCTKIARHFVADVPPAALVGRLEHAWTSSGGDLARVAEALIDAPEAWAPVAGKLKTPYEFVVSSYRALAQPPPMRANQAIGTLGQRTFGAPSPKGWPDEAGPWAASDALVKRMEFAQALSASVEPSLAEPMQLAEASLGARLGPAAAQAIARAETRAEAVALLLMSPEFQRR